MSLPMVVLFIMNSCTCSFYYKAYFSVKCSGYSVLLRLYYLFLLLRLLLFVASAELLCVASFYCLVWFLPCSTWRWRVRGTVAFGSWNGLKCMLQWNMWRCSGICGFVYILYLDNIHILAKILMKKLMKNAGSK